MNTTEKIARASGSKTFQKLNPHLFGMPKVVAAEKEKKPQRIRQNAKPLLNKLEAEYLRILQVRRVGVRSQAITLKLANGVRYTPDFFQLDSVEAWEVKGRHAWEDSLIKLKFAAKEYPEIRFTLVWKEDGQWKEQTVLP